MSRMITIPISVCHYHLGKLDTTKIIETHINFDSDIPECRIEGCTRKAQWDIRYKLSE